MERETTKFRSDLKWLGLSIVIFLLVNAATYQIDATESDEHILSRLSTRVLLIKPNYLVGPVDRPLENCQECRWEDPFKSMSGNGCRWSETYPEYSCRISGLPVTLLQNSRLGGAEQLPLTLLSRALGPLEAARYFKTAGKLCLVLLFFWIIRIFGLPGQILPFLAISPTFHGLGGISCMYIWVGVFCYLSFCLVFSKSRRGPLAGILCLLVAIYIWFSSIISVIPSVVLLLTVRKNPRRALVLVLAAGTFLLARVLVNYVNPIAGSEFSHAMLTEPVWMKSVADVWVYLRDLFDVFSLTGTMSLSSDWAGFASRTRLDSFLRCLGVGVIVLLGFSGFFLSKGTSKKIRSLVGLFLVCSVMSFLFAHNGTPSYGFRFEHLAPLVLIAIYLSAEACGSMLRRTGRSRLALVPMVWLWSAALLSCGVWIYHFRESGPVMTMNADYFTRLSTHLAQRGIDAPILIRETNGVGMIDLFSDETIRPLYMSDYAPPPFRPGADLAKYILSPWVRLGKGTLLQRNVDCDWQGHMLTRADIEGFARENSIEIRSVEFFPYRDNQGYWIIDFINHRFALTASR